MRRTLFGGHVRRQLTSSLGASLPDPPNCPQKALSFPCETSASPCQSPQISLNLRFRSIPDLISWGRRHTWRSFFPSVPLLRSWCMDVYFRPASALMAWFVSYMEGRTMLSLFLGVKNRKWIGTQLCSDEVSNGLQKTLLRCLGNIVYFKLFSPI